MAKIIAIVGMAGAGKTTATDVFERAGYQRIHFGDATMHELEKRGMKINEENESVIRETLRLELGMEAYAILNEPRVKEAEKKGNVVIDGLYSWQEYTYLGHRFPNMVVLAIYASPKTRYHRLGTRRIRPLTPKEAKSRDYSEIENLKKSDPIALADYTIINEGTKEDLSRNIHLLVQELK